METLPPDGPTHFQQVAPLAPPVAERPRSDVRSSSRLPLLLGIMIGLALLWYLPYYLERVEFAKMQGQIRAINEALPALETKLGPLSKSFSLVAAKVGPSVVSIRTSSHVERQGAFGGVQREMEGEASGVVVDAAGYVVTNNHVVDGASEILVKLNNDHTVAAEVVGTDPAVDLAVLKIPSGGLIAADWGDSDQLEVGEMVLAVGNPFGLDRTVTFGIVSAKDRHRVSNSPTQGFLQTDAAVNPGNSGGPLVNMAGRVVGINTAIIGPSYQGVSFALPSNTAHEVYEQIRSGKTVVHEYGYLGVLFDRPSGEAAKRAGLKSVRGALVVQVVADSPAEKAGLRAGDIVTEWDGHPIEDRALLSLLVAQTKVGSTVSMTIMRDGEELKPKVTVGRRPKQ